MNTCTYLRPARFLSLFTAVAVFAIIPAVSHATVITIPNGTFTPSVDDGTAGGVLIGSYTNERLGATSAGKWLATGDGVGAISLVSVLAPRVEIGGGQLEFGSLVGVSTLVRNYATVFNNDIGTNFVTGQTYTLTVDVFANTTLDLALLSKVGYGISLRAAGTDVANSRTQPQLAVTLFNGSSGTISLTYLADSGVNGSNIGVSLFTGQGSGLGTIGLLNTVTFDNLTLTAVPEPAAWACWAGGFGLLAAIGLRRRRRGAN